MPTSGALTSLPVLSPPHCILSGLYFANDLSTLRTAHSATIGNFSTEREIDRFFSYLFDEDICVSVTSSSLYDIAQKIFFESIFFTADGKVG